MMTVEQQLVLVDQRVNEAKRLLHEALQYGKDKNLDWVRSAKLELEKATQRTPHIEEPRAPVPEKKRRKR